MAQESMLGGRIEDVQLEDQIQTSYLDYSMSVIVGARAARRPRRSEAGPPPDPVVDVRAGPAARSPLPQVGQRRRRRDEQVPPARRPRDLRRVGPDGAGLLAARTAGRRARELRLGRRRPAGGPALHGGAARADRARAAPRHRGRDGRLRPELRRLRAAAGRAPGALPEPARQRFGRDRRRDGDEHPAPQPRRGDRRGRALHRAPRVQAEGPDEVRQGSGLPDRRDRHGPRRHQGGLRDRTGLDQGPRRHDDRGGPQRPSADRGDRAAVPGEQGAARREDRRPGADGAPEGRRGREGPLERPRGHAPGRRAQARRQPAGRPEPALQAHAAAGQLRRDHALAGRRRPPDAEPGRDDRLLRRPPDRRRHPAHALRAEEGRGARPHRQGPADRARQPRRGHQGDPRLAGRRGGARQADDAVQAQRGPGEPHPGHAAAAPHPAGQGRARAGAQGPARADPLPEEPAQGPEEDPRGDHGGAARGQEEVREPAAHAAQGRRGRVRRPGPDRRGGRGHHGLPRRVRQAPADRELPPSGPRRQGHPRREPQGRGRGQRRLHDDDAQLAALLHQQGEGLPREGPRGARVGTDRARDLRREPAGGLDHGGREGPGGDRPQGVRGGAVPVVRHPQGDGQEDARCPSTTRRGPGWRRST